MHNSITLKKVVDDPLFATFCFIAVCFVLPRYGSLATMTTCAALMSACVAANPMRFRSRTGSLTAALILVGAMWAVAVVLAGLSLMGCRAD